MFYCDFHDQQELAATNIIGAILKQLAVRSEVLEYVSGVSRGENKGRRSRSTTSGYSGDAKAGGCHITRVFIRIDALDECLFKRLPELPELMRDVLEKSPRT